MKLIKGSHLTPRDQKTVLSSYVRRYTKEHKPAWVTTEPVQFSNDRDWLDNTFFNVTKKFNLDRRSHYCESRPTWPDNPELQR